MDDIIFEDPSKQVSRPKKSSRRVLSAEERAIPDGIIQPQEREPILLNQKRNNPDPNTISPVESSGPLYFQLRYSSTNLIRQ